MFDQIMEFLGIANYVIPDEIKVFVSVLVIYYLIDFILDIIRYFIYYIGDRK